MSPTNAELQARRDRAVPRGVANALPVFIDRAQGAELWDVEGKRYIDFGSGIAVVNTGHGHPRIKAAVAAQLERFAHTAFQVTPYADYVELAERLNDLVPGAEPKQTIFLTTGAEAVENAVKIARVATGRPGIIAFAGGFHGRTLMGMALTGKVAPYKAGFGPFPADIYHVPFPNDFHGVSVDQALAALDLLFKADIEPGRVAAIIVEPVQGEGGFVVAPPAFLQALRKLCDDYGIVLIVDEIQTGFARTGRLFAIEHAGVEPDLMTMAKALAGGFPLSAVTGKRRLMEQAAPGGLGGTYAGPPLGCAAALAVLRVIEEEGLVARADAIGTALMTRLRAMAQRNSFSCIGEVRGLGAMVAMELVKDRTSRAPDPELTRRLVQTAAKNGLVLLSCGTRANVIRLLVPLVASDALVQDGLDLLEASLAELVA